MLLEVPSPIIWRLRGDTHKVNLITETGYQMYINIKTVICLYACFGYSSFRLFLTHWGRVTHICATKLITIGSDNGLSPGRRPAFIWNNAGTSLSGPLGTNLSEVLTEIYTFSFKKRHLKMASGKWRTFCLGLNVLTYWSRVTNSILKTLTNSMLSFTHRAGIICRKYSDYVQLFSR